jgi:DnaJ like chaperone protein
MGALTLVGAFLGLVWGGWFGAFTLGLLGYFLDQRNRARVQGPIDGDRHSPRTGFRQSDTQTAFFNATFKVMGKLAKADGRVCEHEIEMARAIMEQMRLSPEMRQQAIHLFNQGKQAGSDIEAQLITLKRTTGRSGSLKQVFLELQLQAAYADGDLSGAEKRVLQQCCDLLGVSQSRFEEIHRRFRAQQDFYYHQFAHARQNRSTKLDDAYAVLGVSSGDDARTIKRAYRRLMSQHHPDKLVSQGLPEEMMEVAKQKTQEIQQAYDMIRQQWKSA